MEVLDPCVFDMLDEVRRMTEELRQRQKPKHLHESLDRIRPVQFVMAE